MSQPVDIGRFELKYCLPVALRPRVLELARDHVKPDKHGFDLGEGRLGYEVHSLYLDTPGLGDFSDRLDEHKVRDRLRVRTYGPPARGPFPVFLENKRKLENWVIKHRVTLSTDSERFCATEGPEPWLPLVGGVEPKGRYAAEHFVRLTTAGRRVPVSVVHYAREVFVGVDPDRPQVRLTLDHGVTATTRGLTWSGLYLPPDVALVPEGWMVLELKFGGSKPGWMRHLCRELGLRACPVSKFGLSVAMGVAGHRPREVRYVTPRPLRRAGFPSPAPEVRP
jgi:hypothetical protein